MTIALLLALGVAVAGCLALDRRGVMYARAAALALLVVMAAVSVRALFRSPDARLLRQALDVHEALGAGAGATAAEFRTGPGPVVVLDPPMGALAEKARTARLRGLRASLPGLAVEQADLVGLPVHLQADLTGAEVPPEVLDHIHRRHPDLSVVVSFVGASDRLQRLPFPLVAFPAPFDELADTLLRRGGAAALISPRETDGPEAGPPSPGRDPNHFFASHYEVRRSPVWSSPQGGRHETAPLPP